MNKLYKLSFSNENQWHDKRAKWFNEPEGGFPSGTYTVDDCTIIELEYTPKKPIYDEDGNITNPDAKNLDYSVDVYGVIDKIKENFVINNPANWYNVISGVDAVLADKIPDEDWTEKQIQDWLTEQGVAWTDDMEKAELLALC